MRMLNESMESSIFIQKSLTSHDDFKPAEDGQDQTPKFVDNTHKKDLSKLKQIIKRVEREEHLRQMKLEQESMQTAHSRNIGTHIELSPIIRPKLDLAKRNSVHEEIQQIRQAYRKSKYVQKSKSVANLLGSNLCLYKDTTQQQM